MCAVLPSDTVEGEEEAFLCEGDHTDVATGGCIGTALVCLSSIMGRLETLQYHSTVLSAFN